MCGNSNRHYVCRMCARKGDDGIIQFGDEPCRKDWEGNYPGEGLCENCLGRGHVENENGEIDDCPSCDGFDWTRERYDRPMDYE